MAFTAIPMLPAMLVSLVLYPQRVPDPDVIPDGAHGSISRGCEICDNLVQFEAPPIKLNVEALQHDMVNDLKLEDWGPYGWLRVGPGTRGIWRDAGLTSDYVLTDLEILQDGWISAPSGDYSWGRSQMQMQTMQSEGFLRYMNTSLCHIPIRVGFSSAIRYHSKYRLSWSGRYGVCIITCLVSAFGATLVYTAQVRGRAQTRLDRLVLWYFTIGIVTSGFGNAGYLNSICGEWLGGHDLMHNIWAASLGVFWFLAKPLSLFRNLQLQHIMLVKVQDLGPDSARERLVRQMALMLKLEKLTLFLSFIAFWVVILISAPWHVFLLLFGINVFLLFLADLWFSFVSVRTYIAPLLLIRKSLREQNGAEPETAQQLQRAYSLAMWNLCATCGAVLSTSFYYLVFVLVMYSEACVNGLSGNCEWITDIVRAGGPLDPVVIAHIDSIVNDLCTIVFADLLFLNSRASMMERRIGWAIGHVGQHAAMLKQHDEEQQAELNRCLRTLADGPNPKLRHHLAGLEKELRRAIVEEYKTGDAGEAEQMLAKVQSLATEEMQRLIGLADTISELYKRASARYEYIQGIQSFGLGLRQNVPERLVCGQNDNGPVMAFLYMQADLVVEEFNQSIAQLLLAFNEAEDPVDLGLDPQVFCFKIRTGGKGSQAVKLLGPKKTEARGWQKVQNPEDYGNLPFPQAAHLLDIVRAQVKFSEPYALAVFYHYLRSREDICEVVRVKNHFLDEDSAFGYLLVNVRLQDYVAELQLTLENLAELKSCMHAFYKVTRCARLSDLASQTIFHDLYSDKANVVLSPSATQLRQPQQIKATPPPAIIQHPSPPPKEQQVDLEQYILPNSIPRETES